MHWRRLFSVLIPMLLLAGCTPSTQAPKKSDAEADIKQAFAALQGAVKERSGPKVFELLDKDSRDDADRLARAVKESFARADAAKKAEVAKKVGLPEAKLGSLTGPTFLESDLFYHYDEHDEIPDVKGLDKIDVKGTSAKVEYKDPDNPAAVTTLRLVQEDGHWRFRLGMPKAPE